MLPYLNSTKKSIQVSISDMKDRLEDVEEIAPKVDEVLGNMQLIVEGKSPQAESFTKRAGVWTVVWALSALLVSMMF
jgi:hypothetical protein